MGSKAGVSSLLVLLLVATVLVWLPEAGAQGQGRGQGRGGSGGAWEEEFTGPLAKKMWIVSSWWAPGYRPNDHVGYYDPENVSVSGGFLTLRLWQETGLVDTNPNGVISHGALISTKGKYGYGTYEWRMRMSSTSASPNGGGAPVSGSVSAGFIYVDNSATEIDFEYGGHVLAPNDPTNQWADNLLYMVNWHNTNPTSDPTEEHETFSAWSVPGLNDQFHDFKFVWEPGRIRFYVDEILRAEHTTDVPSAPANFMINHWGTNNPFWGGTATVGVDRYFHIDWVRYTPLP